MEPAAAKKKWFSIQEAAEYLDIGEPTLYRWMREGKITFRKVGDSTRFWQEDLDSVMQVYHSDKDVSKAQEVCPVCRHDELVEGDLRSTGVVQFHAKATKFWTMKMSSMPVAAKMCARCGMISLFASVEWVKNLAAAKKGRKETA
jgi:excisionase family DNA binding protein